MLEAAKAARSPAIFPALMLALHAGMRRRDQEFSVGACESRESIPHGRRQQDGSQRGRTTPLNSSLLKALVAHAKWYTKKFGETRPEWHLFPFGKPAPNDPTRPIVTLKTAWKNVRTKANVKGRWHDNRDTMITDLAEGGASDEVIRDIAGHVSKMLKHYSHVRMDAKRKALESLVQPKEGAPQNKPPKPNEVLQEVSQVGSDRVM